MARFLESGDLDVGMSQEPPIMISSVTPTAKFLGVGRDVIGQQLIGCIAAVVMGIGGWMLGQGKANDRQDQEITARDMVRERAIHDRDREFDDIRARVSALEAAQMGIVTRK